MNSRAIRLASGRKRRKPARSWYVLFLTQILLAFSLATHPTWLKAKPRTAASEGAASTRYAVATGGDVRLPQGIGEVCLVGDILVAVVNRRWASLGEMQRRSSAEALAGSSGRFGQVVVFHPSGKLAATWTPGLVQVYP